jgi:probable HAF family extracellular repeat protein
MNRKLLWISAVLGLVSGPVTPNQLAAHRVPPSHIRYVVNDLGTFGGPGTNSSAFDMNNAGWVAGSGNLFPGGPQHAFLWYGQGQLRDLGTLGGPNSEAGGPNASGEAALISETDQLDAEDFCAFGNGRQCLGALWRNGRLHKLLPPRGGHNSQAYGVNNLGQVIGFAETGVIDSSCSTPAMPAQLYRYEAAIWEPNGQIKRLRPLPDDTVGFAFGINDQGLAVGTSGLCSNTVPPLRQPNGAHAVLWDEAGTPHDLGSLGATSSIIATSINNRNQVVGTETSAADGTLHAFVWTRTTGMHDLGMLPGAAANGGAVLQHDQ